MKFYLTSLPKIKTFSFIFFFILTIFTATTSFANVTIITPSDYEVLANPQVGDEYYLDRTYVLNQLPIGLTDGDEELIKTKNDDKTNTSESFVQFTIQQSSRVYVAYNSDAVSPPDWLVNNYNTTSLSIEVNNDPWG